MGQSGRISLGQAVTLRGLVARPGYDHITGSGSVTGLGLSCDRSGPGSVTGHGHVTRRILGPASTLECHALPKEVC